MSEEIKEGGYSSFAEFIRGDYSYDPMVHWVVKPKKRSKKSLGTVSEEDFNEFFSGKGK